MASSICLCDDKFCNLLDRSLVLVVHLLHPYAIAMFDPTLLNCLVPNCNDQRQQRNHLFLFCVLLCLVSFCSFVFGVHVDTCIFYFYGKIKREKGCLEGEKTAAYMHGPTCKEKGVNEMEKESKKQKAIKLLDCYGIFGTMEKEESRETGITFASIIIVRLR